MPKEEKIENIDQLRAEYQKAKAEAEQHIRSDMKKFAEITKALPDIAIEAAARGISAKIEDIDQGFNHIDFSEIESEIALGGAAGIRETANEKWEKSNADRSKIVTGAVTNAKNKMTNMKAKMALSAVKVTSIVGKGLVLFGQKGLAKSMQEKVTEKGEQFISKDSRIGKIMEGVAERGFSVADGVRGAAQTVKEGVESAAKTVSTKAKNAKTSIENEVSARKQAFREAGTRADLDQISIARERADKNRENDGWQQVYDGRSKIVTDKVKEINNRSVNSKSKAALRDIKITGMFAKGVALFGPKGMAEKMQDSVYRSSAKRIQRDSISSRIAKAAAEKGFKVSSKFKNMVKNTKETAVDLKNAAVLTAEEAVENGKQVIEKGKTVVKEGALEFGRKTYKGAAVIGALGSIGLGAVKSGAGKVADKVERGAEFVADKVEDGVNFVADKVENGIDQAKDYKTIAVAKLSRQKSAASKGFKGFLQGMAQGVIDKLTPSIDKDSKNIEAQEQIIEGVKNKGKGSQEPIQITQEADEGPEI